MSNTKPCISLFSSAHRPQCWMNLYKSIGHNEIEFELVFVGPNPPDYELPKNFRFIRSFVKPVQCCEIAARNTTGDLIMDIPDDCLFKTPRPLDRLYETYKAYNNDKLLLSCKFSTDGIDHSHFSHRFYISDPNSPVMPASALMSKKLFNDLGGIDSRFIGVMWNLDIAMRVYALGGEVIVSDVVLDEDRIKTASVLCSEFWEHDRGLLESLWTINGKVCFNRKDPVKPFLDTNILNVSQGPRGRWRGNGPIFFEKLEDSLKKSIFARMYRGIRKPYMYLNYAKRIVSRLKG